MGKKEKAPETIANILNDAIENIKSPTPQKDSGMDTQKPQTETLQTPEPTPTQKETETGGETQTAQGTETKRLKELPIKVYGKEGKAIIDFDEDVVEINVGNKKQKMSLQEFIQKGYASDEKFAKAEEVKRDAETKLQELEKKIKELEAIRTAIPEKIAKGELIETAKNLGIDIPKELLEKLKEADEEGDESAKAKTNLEIMNHIVSGLESRKNEYVVELYQKDYTLLQTEIDKLVEDNEILSSVDSYGEIPIIRSMLGVMFHPLSPFFLALKEKNPEARVRDFMPVLNNVITDISTRIDKYIKENKDNIIPQLIDEPTLTSLYNQNKDLFKEIRKAILEEEKALEGKRNRASSPQGVPAPVGGEELTKNDYVNGSALDKIINKFIRKGE